MERRYTDLRVEEVEYILIHTTSGGPFIEDVFFLVFAKSPDGKTEFWNLPSSSVPTFVDWLKNFPGVSMEQFLKGISCSEDRFFLVYRASSNPILSEIWRSNLDNRLRQFLADHFDLPTEKLAAICEDIFKRYSESHRHYHNLQHILHGLWELDQINSSSVDRAAVELAIWYHDIVYSPSSRSNETNSAQKLREDLELYPSKLNLETVASIILYSPESKERSRSQSHEYFWDIDHSVLGQKELDYMLYKQNIGFEYSSVPRLLFCLKRKAFLRKRLRTGIFQTQEFKAKYEEQAIKNMTSELGDAPYRFLPTLPL